MRKINLSITRKKRILATFFILIFLMGCGGGGDDVFVWDHLPVTVQRVSDDDQEIIDTINNFFGQEIFLLTDEESADCLVEEVTGEENIGGGDESDGLAIIDHDNGIITGCRIKIRDDLDVGFRISVYAHELGHALGSPHFETGIMKPHVSSVTIEFLPERLAGEFEDWVNSNYSDLFTPSE